MDYFCIAHPQKLYDMRFIWMLCVVACRKFDHLLSKFGKAKDLLTGAIKQS